MEETKNNNIPSQEQSAAVPESSEQGRVPEAQHPVSDKNADISQIDQQEGQMNNGRLGGNFDAAGSTK